MYHFGIFEHEVGWMANPVPQLCDILTATLTTTVWRHVFVCDKEEEGVGTC
jgi:hypothetical protein